MKSTERYQGQRETQMKKNILYLVVILFIVLLFFVLLLNVIKTRNAKLADENFESVKDILTYYGCEFKSQKKSTEDNYEYDIYAVFLYDLYKGEQSEEEFYNVMIGKIAEFLNYSNFRMFDEEKEITIEVICQENEIKKIIINGMEDYFIYMDSQMDFSKFKQLPLSELTIQSPELLECIQNNWSADTDFGTRESIFQNYYIYFDEGMKTRKIDGRIYNIVFTDKYQQNVLNGFTVGAKSSIIKERLGTPTFSNDDESIIGYKSEDIYVFFEEDQISIYRNTAESGFDDFFALVDDYLNGQYSLLEFMNELTYTWPDYEEYTYSEDTVFLSYPNKGIDIKINYDDTDGIILYNNIGVNQATVNQYLEHTEFIAKLSIDNVYQAEERRYTNDLALSKKCKEYEEKYEAEDTRGRGNVYDYYMKLDSNENILATYFIAKNPTFFDCELNETIDTYLWANEYVFLYSKKGAGIYYYNLKEQTKGKIITGQDDFKIISYENGTLTYDNTEININM